MLRVMLSCLAAFAALLSWQVAGAAPDFKALVEARAQEIIETRRWLHEHAELSLREVRTQEWMRARLEAIPGVEMVDGDWGTGLVGMLRGGRPGAVVAYRSDMDALPIREETGLPFACTATDSLRDREVGVMHACGHDIHMSVLLGAAEVLSEVREEMAGSVLFILEPGEEIGAGSRMLIEAGVFEDGRMPEAIFAIHDHPTILYGEVSYCPGRASGNVDSFRIKVIGRGGHGAYPHETIDPTVIASRMILAFQSIPSREINSQDQAVISIGSIHGGTARNAIPDTVEVAGTVRSLEPEVREQLRAAIIRTAKGIAAAAGAPEPDIWYGLGTPSMYNDPDLVAETLPTLRRVLGEEKVVRYEPAMGGEDFSRFMEVVPGFMFRLGVGRPDREMNLHSAAFDPDERAIPLGVRLVSEVLWDCLERHAQ
jgi:amidohydrolase